VLIAFGGMAIHAHNMLQRYDFFCGGKHNITKIKTYIAAPRRSRPLPKSLPKTAKARAATDEEHDKTKARIYDENI
jgi:hypothetical protein